MTSEAPRKSIADFELVRRLGDGSFSQVILARDKLNGEEYALKVIDKQYVIRHKVVDYIKSERAMLAALQDPGIVRLEFTFQDAYSLYMGLQYCPNGELYDQIRLRGRMELKTAQFYAAEIVLILEVLRNKGIVHRDLKPENLLLDIQGHLKLIDFGSAKQLNADEILPVSQADSASSEDEASPPLSPLSPNKKDGESPTTKERMTRQVSMVGTADYVSPEILSNKKVSCAADLWALGCIVYQMLVGRPPFKAMSEYLTFQKIIAEDWCVPEDVDVDQDAVDFITLLLKTDPCQRLGARDLQELKSHPFFNEIEDWKAIRTQNAPEILTDENESITSAGTGRSSIDWELQSLAAALPKLASTSNDNVVGSFDEAPGGFKATGTYLVHDEFEDDR